MQYKFRIKPAVLSFFLGIALIVGPAMPSAVWAEAMLGEIIMTGFNFAPRGYASCNGQILPINQNQSLYSLLGTTYGGDGRTTFALPDLRGRMALHRDDNHQIGIRGGRETVTLTVHEIPPHSHTLMAKSTQGDAAIPDGNTLAVDNRENQYSSNAPDVSMHSASIGVAGHGQAHENMPPYTVINYAIALQGLFPSRN